MKYRIAVASSDGMVVNQHFGRASKMLIIDVDADRNLEFAEVRELEPLCEGGNHNDRRLNENVERITDCQYLLVSKIGQGAAYALEMKGIQPFEIPGIIEESVNKLLDYIEVQKLLTL